jgi:glyoxylase-like metal-dependent hydrolase (beta-lactamase superfamily II)
VFVHKKSRVLFVTDLFWNYPETDVGEVDARVAIPLGTKAWKFGMDRVYLPFYRKAMVRDATAFAARRDALLQTAFDKVLPCHGEVVLSGGAKVIAEHLVL